MQPDSALNSRLANYADRVTVDICSAIKKKTGQHPDLELRTWIRVHVGVTAREAAIAGMQAERARHERPRARPPLVMVSPEATQRIEQPLDPSEATTQPMRRHPDHGDE